MQGGQLSLQLSFALQVENLERGLKALPVYWVQIPQGHHLDEDCLSQVFIPPSAFPSA